ncbi:fumarate/nitrate reduction transcriptional regulator Fnr [Massilia aquatica]|uniref:Fumarate/nitrate reduction transcriptional regulator Fnr n=1 Tax=Massilia aquatica TaxID=2609000 RepID=A0ABX0MMQ8_9BURK|nr:fumarate/nitrate reduction transcriptional regulator Fnr [Massilia aquatica]NHZ45046.1 fumarate/nitrate reduction transcriptional regulator Fnr [Massilia aquatica]
MTKLSAPETKTLFNIPALKASCSAFSLHELCLPRGLAQDEIDHLDTAIGQRRRVLQGERLFKVGEPFRKLYAIRYGHFKTVHVDASGDQQVTGFHMTGELLGLDAISNDEHQCDAVALEDSEVCEIPFDRLQKIIGQLPTLLQHFHRLMSQEIRREQHVMLLLGNMRAEQRFAVFLTNLSLRYEERGFSPTHFRLRMSREDIANYLSLTNESISRIVASFKKQGLMTVDKREVSLLEIVRLNSLAAGTEPSAPLR